MGKFDGVLICTDLDGTLYKKDKTISRENQEAIAYFKCEGGFFTFITGRMPYYSMDAYRAVNPNVPFGCVNGGGVYDGLTNAYVWTSAMPDGVCDLIQCVDENVPDAGIQVCAFEKEYFSKDNETTDRFRRLTRVPHLVRDYRSVSEPIAKIIFCSDCEKTILQVEALLRAHPLAEKFDFIRSEKSLFEILPKGVHKGLALAKLVDYLKIDPKRTIAIGDYNNDIGMFGAAGLGIAVSNACKDALEAADLVTVSNEEHAIARVIYDLESGRIKF